MRWACSKGSRGPDAHGARACAAYKVLKGSAEFLVYTMCIQKVAVRRVVSTACSAAKFRLPSLLIAGPGRAF